MLPSVNPIRVTNEDINRALILPENVWRSFVDDNPLGNIFHTPEMYKVFSKTKGHFPELWAAVDEGGLPLALLLPVKISVFDGWLRQLTTRAVVFGSVLWSPGRGPDRRV